MEQFIYRLKMYIYIRSTTWENGLIRDFKTIKNQRQSDLQFSIVFLLLHVTYFTVTCALLYFSLRDIPSRRSPDARSAKRHKSRLLWQLGFTLFSKTQDTRLESLKTTKPEQTQSLGKCEGEPTKCIHSSLFVSISGNPKLPSSSLWWILNSFKDLIHNWKADSFLLFVFLYWFIQYIFIIVVITIQTYWTNSLYIMSKCL